ncbi:MULTISPECIES: hypothetical protein [unclassified Rhizobium]|jgi:hypothetical protein|uniref:hypothetical protein n=1 Tax=unclassified Rhizobium TaxID=2613769 RepID=UPI0011C371A9|nr:MULTISPECIES: hypothetical protein [unclassified Rhizobium]MBN8949198.1 hypothetical protein [Rhizobium tropici]
MKRMEKSSGSETSAPLPLNKPAHIDDEADLGKSTARPKKSAPQPKSPNRTTPQVILSLC